MPDMGLRARTEFGTGRHPPMYGGSKGIVRSVPEVTLAWIAPHLFNFCWRCSQIAMDQAEQIFEPVEGIVVSPVVRYIVAKGIAQDFKQVVVERRKLTLAAGQKLF